MRDFFCVIDKRQIVHLSPIGAAGDHVLIVENINDRDTLGSVIKDLMKFKHLNQPCCSQFGFPEYCYGLVDGFRCR